MSSFGALPEPTQIVNILNLKVGARLQRLTLYDMWVSSVDVLMLVYGCQNLKLLSLRRCAFVHTCHARWLVELDRHLTQLDLRRTSVPENVISLLRQVLPFARIKPASSYFKRDNGTEKDDGEKKHEDQEARGKRMSKYLEESEKKGGDTSHDYQINGGT